MSQFSLVGAGINVACLNSHVNGYFAEIKDAKKFTFSGGHVEI